MTNHNLESALSIGTKSHPERRVSLTIAPQSPPNVNPNILKDIELNTRISLGRLGPEIQPEKVESSSRT